MTTYCAFVMLLTRTAIVMLQMAYGNELSRSIE